MTIRGILHAAGLCSLLVACAGEDGSNPGEAAAAADATPAQVAAAPATSSFQATVSGAVDRTLNGGALSGARYGRYHINMASEGNADQPIIVIAFGRTDTDTPAPRTYTLGGSDAAFQYGHVEVYGNPQREFDVTAGELEITAAVGDVLTGRFSFTARESPEEYDGPSAEIRVEGTFLTRPAN